MAKRAARPAVGIDWIITWPLMLVFAAMVFLTTEEIRTPVHDVPEPLWGPDWDARLPDRISAVTTALQQSALPLQAPVEERKGSGSLRWTHRRYEAGMPESEREKVEAALALLRVVDPGVTATAAPVADGLEVQVGLDGLLIHTVHVHWETKPTRPRLAVVIGGLGDDLRLARTCVGLDGPVALGVRPFRLFSKEVAELGHLFKREIVLHLDGTAEAGGAVPADATAAQALDAALASVPHAIGVAGSMGESAERQREVQEEIQRRGLLLIGGAPVVGIDQDVAGKTLGEQLGDLVATSRNPAGAIGIGGANEATLAALQAALSEWRAADVEVVSVSALVSPVALSAR